MMPGATEPGETPRMMTETMEANWRRKAERMPDIARDLARLDAEPPVLHHLLHDGGLLRLG
jgi:hypothetical protein